MTNTQIDNAYVGASQVEKIYLGTELIYPSGTPPEPSYEGEYFTIEALGNGNLTVRSETPYYSINGGEWAHPLISTPLSLNQGDKVRFKATPNAPMIGLFSGNTLSFKVYGNIESLDYGDDFTGATSVKMASGFTGYFYNCSGLTEAHNLVLPAITLTLRCYREMFYGCSSLTTAPELPATNTDSYCYQFMFRDCTSLTKAPELPATRFIGNNCYTGMFRGCTSLTTAPELPATALTNNCYASMFSGCTSLTTAPELPATTLADHCYFSMFNGCTSLTSAHELPATTLAKYCYQYMFSGCTSLNYIKCLATDISASTCTDNWVSGVAATGTFVKSSSMGSWTTGNNGIPTGWTVVDG